jgi:hypothetical protein
VKQLKAVLGVLAVAGILAGVACTLSTGDQIISPTQTNNQSGSGSPAPSPSPSNVCGLAVSKVEISGPNVVKAGQAIALGLTASSVAGPLPPACLDGVSPSWTADPPASCVLVGNQAAFGNTVKGVAAGSCSVTASVLGVASAPFVVTVN